LAKGRFREKLTMAKSAEKSAFDLNVKVKDLENIPDEPPKVTDKLRPKPKLSARLSPKIIFIGASLFVVMFWIYMSSVDEMEARKHNQATTESLDDEENPGDPHEVAKRAPKDLIDNTEEGTGNRLMTLVKPVKPKVVAEPEKGMFPDSIEPQVPSIHEAKRSESSAEIPAMKGDPNRPKSNEEMSMMAEQQEKQKALDERFARMQQARQGGMKLVAFSATKNESLNTNSDSDQEDVQGGRTTSRQPSKTQAALDGLPQALAKATGGQSGGGDQDQKAEFIKNSANEPVGYHPYRTVKAVSKNELKIGTYIPMSLNQGINSDLPGQITARVTENVYDSVAGCRLLLPAMTTVIGRYDSKVSAGQTRNLVVWNYLVFPDGSELNLGAMQGYDTNGFSGIEAETDNHFWKLFGLTLGMSTVTATMQAAVPQQNNAGNTVQNPGQLLQGQIAQQYGNLGAQIIGKQLAVQPTLKNYPGERFMITIPHTIIMDKVWRYRCNS
jgi:type IV secretory pathway VirB10-like protein